ncbi:hypothetical protein LNP74_25605 [Klebsiella pneumoniae subsp. pneumoniae]|nr:hypothetical protein [Klebsiella pneumoniae subsp. pneumoniae]
MQATLSLTARLFHYPNEKWFPLTEDDEVPEGLLDARLRAFYDPDDQLTAQYAGGSAVG